MKIKHFQESVRSMKPLCFE